MQHSWHKMLKNCETEQWPKTSINNYNIFSTSAKMMSLNYLNLGAFLHKYLYMQLIVIDLINKFELFFIY